MFEISTGGSTTVLQPEPNREGTMKNILLILALIPGLSQGHHGWAAFDKDAVVTFTGTVTDFHFVNPHSVVEFEVKDEKGQVRKWQGELTSPAHLTPRGWTRTSLAPGDQITVTGYPAKNSAPSLWITKIRLPNGQELKPDAGN